MTETRSRAGILVAVTAAAGAFGAAAMMSGATAPAARADDLSDIISAINEDLMAGQGDLSTGFTEISGGDLTSGLLVSFDGLNQDLLSAPDSLVEGTVQALTGESTADDAVFFGLGLPNSFADAVSLAQSDITDGESYFTAALTDLSGGDYGGAALSDLTGADLVSVLPLQELILGAVSAFDPVAY